MLFVCVLASAALGQGDSAARLSEIANQLKDPKSDGISLLTEAVRRCGFAVWTEDRNRMSEPLTTPGLGLAVTDREIEGYVELYRRGDHVAAEDLVNALDPIYRELGGKKGLPVHLDKLVRLNLFGEKSAQRMLASFLQDRRPLPRRCR